MPLHSHSLDTYRQEKPKLSNRACTILDWLERHGPATDREVMVGLGFADMNAVRPRITELIKLGRARENESKSCPVTGKTVRLTQARISPATEIQSELPLSTKTTTHDSIN